MHVTSVRLRALSSRVDRVMAEPLVGGGRVSRPGRSDCARLRTATVPTGGQPGRSGRSLAAH